MAKRTLRDRLLGRTPKERQRRKQGLFKSSSWVFVGVVLLIAIMLIGQFVTRIWMKPPVTSDRTVSTLLVKKGERIQVNVLNGSGRSHIAQKFTDFLRARKFDVVGMMNFKDTNVEHTFLIDRINDSEATSKVAYALGLAPNRIVRQVDTEEYVDADIVIGKDFTSLNPLK